MQQTNATSSTRFVVIIDVIKFGKIVHYNIFAKQKQKKENYRSDILNNPKGLRGLLRL